MLRAMNEIETPLAVTVIALLLTVAVIAWFGYQVIAPLL